ncbi:GAF and ANTAR domain-containing protein [Paractinoplanes hotanensis]|uniref:GAF and ANTAR domain-containing protein n=1 Tax=Paractinoplanes hotanensis TaxID=2906497 RepID=A0ABT0YF30_9ACTN|nr:GAF and ANTAR domain-containing protein [Actinoplanes hotanensis]MCM4084350.1 GAF and ANTAR domain-containing protein [Actinoplanes hotanensis]
MVTEGLATVLVEIADTLGEDFDTSAFLFTLTQRSVQLMDIGAAGGLLADDHGVLRLSAASSPGALLLQQLQLRTGSGPGVDCYRTGRSVSADNLPADDRWPEFAAGATDAGFAAVHVVAMRHHLQTVGALSFLTGRPGPLDPDSLDIGRTLSEIATIGLLQHDSIRTHELQAAQLQTALDSRILIEQAKGILSERLGLTMNDAFGLLRSHARSHNRRLRDVARGVVDSTERLGPPAADRLTSSQAGIPPTHRVPPSDATLPARHD